jgi:transposase
VTARLLESPMTDQSHSERLGPDGEPLWVPKAAWQGRPTKLTQLAGDVILEAVAAGLGVALQAKSAGVDEQTVRNWLKRGESDDPKDAGYAAFLGAYQKAEAKAAFYAMKNVLMAQERWQAFAWYMERKYADEWGLKKDQFPMGSVNFLKQRPDKAEDDLDPALVDDSE